MSVQTLTLAGKRYVLMPEREYQRLTQQSRQAEDAPAEDRRDATTLRRRLAEMRRRGEKPIPYAQARRQMGLA